MVQVCALQMEQFNRFQGFIRLFFPHNYYKRIPEREVKSAKDTRK